MRLKEKLMYRLNEKKLSQLNKIGKRVVAEFDRWHHTNKKTSKNDAKVIGQIMVLSRWIKACELIHIDWDMDIEGGLPILQARSEEDFNKLMMELYK